MAGEKILIADDEANIRDLAGMYLEQAGFEVVTVANGREALDHYDRTAVDVVILDLMMPEIDGWELCRQLRARGEVPIIMLTARDDDIDKIVGLEMGADDYVTKPFNPRELVARVRSILRRAAAPVQTAAEEPAIRRLADLTINPQSQEVFVDHKKIPLRRKEFDLLLTLVDHQNQVLTRDQLLDQVWGYEYYGNTRTVDVHVAQLREKLGESQVSIETVWGKGYKIRGLED